MKIKSLLFIMLTGLLYSPIAFAQDEATVEAPQFTIAGSIDTYFHKSFGADTYEQPRSAFANLNGFGLGMANLIASYGGEKVGFVADLVYGPRGVDAVFYDAYSSQRIVNQLYAYVRLGKVVTLNLGQFNTFLGYEVISPTVNFHYSTSYLFSYGPFSHTGLRADFDFGGGLVGKFAIMNATDHVEFNDTDTYTVGAQLGYSNDNGGVWLNVLSGDQSGVDGAASTFQIDLTTGWNLTKSFYLGLNTSLQKTDDGSFSGVALYPKISLSDNFALGLRGEYFMVKEYYLSDGEGNGTVIGLGDNGDGNVLALTFTANYSIGNLMIIPEFRVDNMSDDFFVDGNSLTKSLSTFTLAAVYKF